MSLYQELIDAGFEEYDLETRIGEGWTIEAIYVEAADMGFIEVETGCCMCGDRIEGHSWFDSHTPVDEGLYRLDRMKEQLACSAG